MCEVWKTIDEYPEYEVSNHGNVRSKTRDYIDSMGRKYHKTGQILKLETQIGEDDYKQVMVSLWSNKKMHRLIVARLVAKAFIQNPNNHPQVNHKDEDSTNNFVDNLEWCTARYNTTYKDIVERRSKKKCRPIDVFDINGCFLETIKSGVEANKKYNVSRGMISSCCNGDRASAKGYIFKFH